jgi:hypothetical protein
MVSEAEAKLLEFLVAQSKEQQLAIFHVRQVVSSVKAMVKKLDSASPEWLEILNASFDKLCERITETGIEQFRERINETVLSELSATLNLAGQATQEVKKAANGLRTATTSQKKSLNELYDNVLDMMVKHEQLIEKWIKRLKEEEAKRKPSDPTTMHAMEFLSHLPTVEDISNSVQDRQKELQALKALQSVAKAGRENSNSDSIAGEQK